jgi:hypothetical protein
LEFFGMRGSAEEEAIYLGALKQGFNDLGYIDGKTIALEHRFPNEQPERFASLAVELAALPVDVLVAVQAAMGITIGQLRAQFAEAYEMARELSQPVAMVTATTAQAKLAGLWIERSEQTRKQPDEMSDAEIAAILRANAN